MAGMSDLIAALPTLGTVRILSDLHLGHDMSTVRSTASLRPLIAGAQHVIFNGDTLQERAGAFRVKSLAMVAELQAMCQEEGAAATFLRGNHDPTEWALEHLDLMDGLVTVTHGDVWLRLISPWSISIREYRPILEAIHAEYPPTERLDLTTRYEILRRCRLALPPSETRQRGHSLADRAALFCRQMWPPRRPLEVLKVYAQLPGLASEFVSAFRPQSRVLLFGHTHRAKVWRRSQRLLINTGAFVTFATPLLVEIQNRILTVHPLAESGGLWQKKAPIATQLLS
jgi:predicted phosphodiesterase